MGGRWGGYGVRMVVLKGFWVKNGGYGDGDDPAGVGGEWVEGDGVALAF